MKRTLRRKKVHKLTDVQWDGDTVSGYVNVKNVPMDRDLRIMVELPEKTKPKETR